MELIYGNDRINYRVLAKSASVDAQIENELLAYCGFLVPTMNEAYTDPKNLPECILYTTRNTGNAGEEKQIVTAKLGKMLQYEAPSYYAQVLLKDVDKGFYREDFFRLFHNIFLDSVEAVEQSNPLPEDRELGNDPEVSEDALTKEQLKVLLMLFFRKMETGSVMRIISDVGGDGFNLRARSILATLYHYLPYDCRRRFGFATYMSPQQTGYSGVFLEVYDPAQLIGDFNADIDMANCDYQGIISSFADTSYADFTNSLLRISDEERKGNFDRIESVLGMDDFSVSKWIEFSDYYKAWRKETAKKPIEELIPEWARYISDNGGMGGNLYNNLINLIRERLSESPKVFRDYLYKALQKADKQLWELPHEVKQLFYMMDEMEEQRPDPEFFLRWYEDDFLKSRGIILQEEDIDKLINAKFGSKTFKSLRDYLVNRLKTGSRDVSYKKDAYSNGLETGRLKEENRAPYLLHQGRHISDGSMFAPVEQDMPEPKYPGRSDYLEQRSNYRERIGLEGITKNDNRGERLGRNVATDEPVETEPSAAKQRIVIEIKGRNDIAKILKVDPKDKLVIYSEDESDSITRENTAIQLDGNADKAFFFRFMCDLVSSDFNDVLDNFQDRFYPRRMDAFETFLLSMTRCRVFSLEQLNRIDKWIKKPDLKKDFRKLVSDSYGDKVGLVKEIQELVGKEKKGIRGWKP
ncbi:MAG: hypothetical protein J6N53_18040 [Lachnospiraceae bacterium]|nr:hypothetical protein [Lachnospiraceae bacterium]